MKRTRFGLSLVALLLVIATGAGAAGGATSKTRGFQVRPVACYAPAYQPGTTPSLPVGILPPCRLGYALTGPQLDVTPNPTASTGFTGNQVPADPDFAGVLSTPLNLNLPGAGVLLPGTPGSGPASRYVLGPAGLTSTAVLSARAISKQPGYWVIDVRLTRAGAMAWDRLARSQFHRIVAIVINGDVISAPVLEPTQNAFTSFKGQLQVAGNWTARQAKTLAAQTARA